MTGESAHGPGSEAEFHIEEDPEAGVVRYIAPQHRRVSEIIKFALDDPQTQELADPFFDHLLDSVDHKLTLDQCREVIGRLLSRRSND